MFLIFWEQKKIANFSITWDLFASNLENKNLYRQSSIILLIKNVRYIFNFSVRAKMLKCVVISGINKIWITVVLWLCVYIYDWVKLTNLG